VPLESAEDLVVEFRGHPEGAPHEPAEDLPGSVDRDRPGVDATEQEAEKPRVLPTLRLGNGPSRDLIEDEAIRRLREEQGGLSSPEPQGGPRADVPPHADDLDPGASGLAKGCRLPSREDLLGHLGRNRDASQEFSKQAAKEFIHGHAKISLGNAIQYMPLKGEARVAEKWRFLENLTEEQRAQITVPVLRSPEDCYIVVVGADRAKTAVFPSGPAPVTVGIDQYRR